MSEWAGQMDFFAPYVAGSATSHEAARSIEGERPNLRQRVLDFIAEHPGASDERIAEGLDMNPSTCRPRRVELERAGLIEKAGATITHSGRKAWGWAVVPEREQGFRA